MYFVNNKIHHVKKSIMDISIEYDLPTMLRLIKLINLTAEYDGQIFCVQDTVMVANTMDSTSAENTGGVDMVKSVKPNVSVIGIHRGNFNEMSIYYINSANLH